MKLGSYYLYLPFCSVLPTLCLYVLTFLRQQESHELLQQLKLIAMRNFLQFYYRSELESWRECECVCVCVCVCVCISLRHEATALP
jgi:hypothetical protein